MKIKYFSLMKFKNVWQFVRHFVGVEMVTEFIMTCADWKSAEIPNRPYTPVPLYYRFKAYPDVYPVGQILYFGSQSSTTPMKLSKGSPGNDYNLTLTVEVSDIYGSKVTRTLYAVVSWHDREVTWGSWGLKSPATRLFVQQIHQTNIKKSNLHIIRLFVPGMHRWPVDSQRFIDAEMFSCFSHNNHETNPCPSGHTTQ